MMKQLQNKILSIPSFLKLLAFSVGISGIQGCGDVATISDQAAISSANYKPIAFSAEPLLAATVNIPYKEILQTNGGIPPLTFKITKGVLPTGLSMEATTGVLSGTVAESEVKKDFSFEVSVSDGNGVSDEQSFSIKVNAYAYVIAPLELPPLLANQPYNVNLSGIGAVKPVKWVIVGDAPSGMTLEPTTGLLSIDPAIVTQLNAADGGGKSEIKLTVKAIDKNGIDVTKSFTVSFLKAGYEPITLVDTELMAIATDVAYKEIIPTLGGAAPLAFKILKGDLPKGLVLDPATGVISGKVLATSLGNKQSVVNIQVTDVYGKTAEKIYTLSIVPYAIAIVPQEVPAITPMVSYGIKLGAVGGVKPITYALVGDLPSRLKLAADGTLSTTAPHLGLGTANTEWPVEVTATDAQGIVGKAKLTLKVGPAPANSAPLGIQNLTLAAMVAGSDYNSGVMATGGVAPYKFQVISGSLPSGLILDPLAGTITGSLGLSSGNTQYAAIIKVTDAIGDVLSQSYSGAVTQGSSALAIATTTLPTPNTGSTYAAVISVTGGKTPYRFTTPPGALPSGLALSDTTGAITGTPAFGTAGTAYVFTVTVTDASNQTAAKSFSGTIGSSSAALAVQTPSIVAPTAGSPYLQLIAATGGLSPYTFSVVPGTLPSGLNLNPSTGMISGTVAYAARNSPYLFTITVTDANASSATQTYAGFVGNYTISLLPASLPPGTPGTYYTSTVITVGGEAAYSYTRSGTLPTGLSFDGSTGQFSGTVADSEAGLTKNFTITSTDANGATTNRAYSMATVAFEVTLSTASLAAATEGQAYTNGGQNLAASGGTPPYTYEYSGNLPSGIGLTSAGVFFGTPSYGQGALSAGTNYTLQIRVRDAQNRVSQAYTRTLNVGVSLPVVASDSPPVGVLGATFSYNLSASGGRPGYTYTRVSGNLPTGLTMTTAGVISGTPTAATSCPAGQFTVKAEDSLSQNSANVLKCIATVTGVSLTNTSFPTVVTGVNYASSLTAIGGTTPYFYTSTGLPSALSLHPTTGALSGYGVATGDYTVYFTVTDSSSPALTSTQPFVFKVRDPLVITTTTVNRAGSGILYSPVTVLATGGQTPYTFSINSGSLPSGLTLSTAGVISGTPAANSSAGDGTYTFSIVVRDAAGLTSAAQSYTLYVTRGPKITTRRLPTAVVGRPYAYDIMHTGGVNTFISTANLASRLTWGATGLPTGLSVNTSSGRISGTPGAGTAAGSPYTVTLSVSDQHGISATKSVALEIRTAGLTFNTDLPRMTEPCPAGASINCEPIASAVGVLVPGTPTTKYMVYSAVLLGSFASPTSSVIYISRIDSNGLISTPGTSNLTVAYTVTPGTGSIGGLDLGDIDNDGFIDIVYSDRSAVNSIVVVWNSGTTDANGMPIFSSKDTFAMPASGSRPMMVKVRQLRPDATNSNKKDLIVVDYDVNASGTSARMVVFLAQNACSTNCSGTRSAIYTGTGASITAYNTTIAAGAGLTFIGGMDSGYFNTAPATGVCPSLAITGRRNSGNPNFSDHIFLRHQAYVGGVCNGNFGTHATTDEALINGSNTNGIPSHPAIADLNNDGISDIAVVMRWTAIASSATVKVYIMPGGNLFPAPLTPLLPFTTGINYVGGSITPYCMDGTSTLGSPTCLYPGLLVAGGRDRSMVLSNSAPTAPTGAQIPPAGSGFLSFLPNQGSPNWFEDNTGNNRIDYEGIPGIGINGIITTPLVTATSGDIVFMGSDNNSYPFYFMAPRNGSSTTSPLKLTRMALSTSDYLANNAEVGTMKLLNINPGDTLDLVNHLINTSAISVLTGDLATDVPSSIPNPTSNPIGSNFGLTNTYHYQATMDSADFNEDGYPDFATVGNAGRVVTVNFGDGTSTIGNSIMLEPGVSGDLQPRVINARDYDNDGHDDMIVYNYNNTTTNYSMAFFKGNGNGTFATAQEFNLASAICGPSGDVRTMISKDLNGDGRPEIAILCATAQALWVIRRHADSGGTWVRNGGSSINPAGGTIGTALAIGFLTSTTGNDLVLGGADIANSYRIINGLQLTTPDTNGAFNVTAVAINPYQPIRGNLNSAEITDLDNDGYGDIILTPATQNSVTTALVNSHLFYTCHTTAAGACTRRSWGGYGGGMAGITVGDLDDNGLNDFIIGTRSGGRLFYRMLVRGINKSQ